MKLSFYKKTKSNHNKFSRKFSSKLRKKLKVSNEDSSLRAGYDVGSRKNPWRHKSILQPYVKIVAPVALDLWKKKPHTPMIEFIRKIKKEVVKASSDNTKIIICFSNTRYINSTAAIYMYAEVDRLVRRYPRVRFSVVAPSEQKNSKSVINLVDPVLIHLGFYKLLGRNKKLTNEHKSVTCWHIVAGQETDMEKIDKILSMNVNDPAVNEEIYRALAEAISNAAEHAYHKDIESHADTMDKRHWFLTSVQEGKLNVLVCDLGHGIPNTLGKTETTKEPGRLNRIFDSLKLDDEENKRTFNRKHDAKKIQAAMQISNTRTNKSHRGKGGQDLTGIVKKVPNSELLILSRKGFYHYSPGIVLDKYGTTHERKLEVDGTIVGWSIPISERTT